MEVLFEFHKNGELKYSELEEDYNKTLELIESLEYKNMLSNEGTGFGLDQNDLTLTVISYNVVKFSWVPSKIHKMQH